MEMFSAQCFHHSKDSRVCLSGFLKLFKEETHEVLNDHFLLIVWHKNSIEQQGRQGRQGRHGDVKTVEGCKSFEPPDLANKYFNGNFSIKKI